MSDTTEIIETPIGPEELAEIEKIELFFFAYRDFISDPDRILSQYGFGRAHHRTLYFVNRTPGMTVAELLEILNITKQSLSRVLRELIDSGYIVQATGKSDRRKRMLFPTTQGRELILALSTPQSRRIERALASIDDEGQKQVGNFLRQMLADDQQQPKNGS